MNYNIFASVNQTLSAKSIRIRRLEMYHNLVNVQSRFIKQISRDRLQNKWGAAILGYIMYMFFLNFIPDLCGVLIPQGRVMIVEEIGYSIPIIRYLYDLILAGPFMLGATVFLLKIVRNREVEPGYIFSGFEYFLKSFLLALLMSLFIMFWTMLFIIPGFIAFYRYRMAFYILADDPRKSPMQCLAESKFMMAGNKGALFGLDFSFIGWLLLAAVVPGVLVAMEITTPSFTGEMTLSSTIIAFILDIPTFIAMLYLRTSTTVFYEIASGRLNVGNNPNMGFNGPNGPNNWNNPNGGNGNNWNNNQGGWNNMNNGGFQQNQQNQQNQQSQNQNQQNPNWNNGDYNRGQGGNFNNNQPGSDWNYGDANTKEKNYYNEEAVNRAKSDQTNSYSEPSQANEPVNETVKEAEAQVAETKTEPVTPEVIAIPPTEEKKEEEVIEAVENIDEKIEVEQGELNESPVCEENQKEESVKQYNEEMVNQFKDIFSKNSDDKDNK